MLGFENGEHGRDNREAGKTEVLCLSANKLFSSAGKRTEIAKGLVHV